MMANVCLLFLALFYLSPMASAEDRPWQTPRQVSQHVIVKFSTDVKADKLSDRLRIKDLKIVRTLSPSLNLFLVRTTSNKQIKSFSTLLSTVRSIDGVVYAQADHAVKLRARQPNDPQFAQQWSLQQLKSGADVHALDAWDIGTGGKDAAGNDIVVAVVDGGVALTHSNLVPNLWINRGEVAGNGVDDDGNGFVDDVNGWNAFQGNGKIPESYHGTHVAGIIGARGNDASQVTGVNWDTKLMIVAGASSETSTVLAAYGYVLEQKKLWLSTQGQKGANVVVTNSSFGVDLADCQSDEYPAWNDMYNALGKVGILSAAATANMETDVDAKGDVPTGCNSDFIVTVTNTTSDGKKYRNAGYGKTTIDLGAPGTNILSTVSNGGVETLSGTSMSTPHVAGGVALLHHVASVDFNNLYKAEPGKAALALKRIMLSTVTPQADLANVTVSGGRLNLFGAAKEISAFH